MAEPLEGLGRRNDMGRALAGALAVLLGAAVLVLPAEVALACECEGTITPSQLAIAHAAVVGTVTAMGPERPGESDIPHRSAELAVEASVHRDLGAAFAVDVDVSSSCAVDLEVGGRVGIVLHTPGSTAHLCSVHDADALLAAATLPEPTATGPPAFVASGDLFGQGYAFAPVAYLDADGRLLGYGPWDTRPEGPFRGDRGHLDTWLADVCPGGQRTVERAGSHAWAGQRPAPRIVTRDAVTGAVHRATGLHALLDDDPRSGPNIVQAAHCLDEGGDDVLVVLGYYDPPEQSPRRIVRVTGGEHTTVATGAFSEVIPTSGSEALARLGDRLVRLDLATGATTDLLALPQDTAGLAVPPGGGHALLLAGPDHRDPAPIGPSRLQRIELDPPTLASEVTIPGTDGRFAPWWRPTEDGGALVVVSGEGGSTLRRYDADLAETAVVEGVPGLPVAERDGVVFLAQRDEPGLLRLDGDRVVPVGDAPHVGSMLALPDGVAPFRGQTGISAAIYRPSGPAPSSPRGAETPGTSGSPSTSSAPASGSEAPRPVLPAILLAVVSAIAYGGLRARR